MRTVFFGTPSWAVPSLDALLKAGVEVRGVITNPDRPSGRGLEPSPSPIKQAASGAGLEVLQPHSARDPGLRATLEEWQPDVAVVVAYGSILPGALLRVPRLGFVNLHFSLLPSYRGAAPVQRAIMDGLDETGVSVMVLTEGMDEGPVLATEAIPIGARETAGELGERLASVGAALLPSTLEAYAAERVRPVEQDHSRATYAPKITAEVARIDWSRPGAEIDAHVRGLNPAPGAWTMLRDLRVKVFRVERSPEAGDLAPGRIRSHGELEVGTADVTVTLIEVQAAGRRRMPGSELVRGLRPAPDAAFE